jgi:chaperonin cofactor prefoldin
MENNIHSLSNEDFRGVVQELVEVGMDARHANKIVDTVIKVIDRRSITRPEVLAEIQRLESRDDRLEMKIDHLAEVMNARFDAIDVRFEAIDIKFEAIDKKIDSLEDKFNLKFDNLTDKITMRILGGAGLVGILVNARYIVQFVKEFAS